MLTSLPIITFVAAPVAAGAVAAIHDRVVPRSNAQLRREAREGARREDVKGTEFVVRRHIDLMVVLTSMLGSMLTKRKIF